MRKFPPEGPTRWVVRGSIVPLARRKGDATKMRLLYVEDQAAFRAVVIPRFFAGHEVTVASTLAEARALVSSRTFDAVLLDYDLPDGKGIELLEDLQQSGWTGSVVAVSSREENNAHLMAAGAAATVSKMKFGEISAVLEQLEQQLRS
jgi:DNA-binding response OmpR family regulator